MKRVLFLALSGIGNFLMQLPTIEAFKKAHPDWPVTVWVAPRGTKALAQAVPSIDAVIEGKIRRSLISHIRFTHRLAKQHPDVAIMLSPGQQIKGAAYMFLMGAHQRIAHRYPYLGSMASSFLLTDSVAEQADRHDIEQNISLLQPLGIATTSATGQSYQFTPPEKNIQQAQEIIQALQIPRERKLIGLHAGSAPDFLWKRWPLDRFAEVAKTLITTRNAHVLVFGGPDERQQKKQLQKMIGKAHTSIIDANLCTTAAVMQRCHVFLANDSGLMHLAAASDVSTIGIFGPTDEAKTGPRGRDSHVIRAPGTGPVYDTEHNFDLGQKPHDSLLQVTSGTVLAAAVALLR